MMEYMVLTACSMMKVAGMCSHYCLSPSEIPSVGRPKRDRRPNVKYNSEEYDLPSVSASKKRLLLSGLCVKQGRPKTRGSARKCPEGF